MQDEMILPFRIAKRFLIDWRPYLGWPVFLMVTWLSLLPAQAIRATDWINPRNIDASLEWIGPVSVFILWILLGWQTPRTFWGRNAGFVHTAQQQSPRVRGLLSAVWPAAIKLWVLLVISVLFVSQFVIGWLPTFSELISIVRSGAWATVLPQMSADLTQFTLRFNVWWQGVSSGGAAQDDLVFAALAGIVLWVLGFWTTWIIRQPRLSTAQSNLQNIAAQSASGNLPKVSPSMMEKDTAVNQQEPSSKGFVAALPILWVLVSLALYGNPQGEGQRYLILVALALAVLLHIFFDHHRLVTEWERLGLDFNPDLFIERGLTAVGVCALIFAAAGLMPSITIEPIASFYYRLMSPVNEQIETTGERMFPDIDAVSYAQQGGIMSGLPNDFLLSGDPNLGERVVMRVRTNEPIPEDLPEFYDAAPMGHYMRGATLSMYNGLGWSNPQALVKQRLAANTSWAGIMSDQTDPALSNFVSESKGNRQVVPGTGRRTLVQNVFLYMDSRILFGAGEPIEPGVDYRADLRTTDDLVALWSRIRGTQDESYTLISAVPALNTSALRKAYPWIEIPEFVEDGSAQNDLSFHLRLPPSVTDRTKELAVELTDGLTSPFEKASAIEAFLRTYEYDLNIPEPPDDVEDIADYFLFDLQRGYCDYYATAFTVLARLSGLPTRFATGYAVGRWDPIEFVWVITEAEAHSWPEVYFPEYGWIAFEPTAGRSELERIGTDPTLELAGGVQLPSLPQLPETTLALSWYEQLQEQLNWQMTFWLLPLAGLLWGGWLLVRRWQTAREEPWPMVLRWGQRMGRPLMVGETVLEYGQELSDFLVERGVAQTHSAQADQVRIVSREIRALSQDVSMEQYGLHGTRAEAVGRIQERWQRLRGYLRSL
ncbi:MAG: transglutaminase domain-containing protein [Chloroflexota bacterium]